MNSRVPHPAEPQPKPDDLAERVAALQERVAGLNQTLEHHGRLATLGTIAGLIAHEFNNILTPMVSYAHMALAAPGDRELTRKALQRTIDAAGRASEITRAILGFVKDERGETPVGVKALGSEGVGGGSRGTDERAHRADVEKVVEEALACLARDPVRAGIRLEVRVTKGCRASIRALHLQHVLVNVLLNAWNAMMPKGGTLWVVGERTTEPPVVDSSDEKQNECSTWNIRLLGESATKSGSAGEEWVVVRVEDNGKGMTGEHVRRLFEPYFRANLSGEFSVNPALTGLYTHEPMAEPGTGLGMALCRRLIEDAGGWIVVESEVGKGTAVMVVVPAA